jgi:aspartate/methionine/tyrosine aminotransferase
MQKAAVAALDQGDAFIQMQVDRALKARDILCEKLLVTGKVELSPPEGAFYLYFKVSGVNDSMQAAFSIVDNVKVGIAPGSAFAANDSGWFRVCFNRNLDEIEDGASRIAAWVTRFA